MWAAYATPAAGPAVSRPGDGARASLTMALCTPRTEPLQRRRSAGPRHQDRDLFVQAFFVVGAASTDTQSGQTRTCYLPSPNAPEKECWYISMRAVTHTDISPESLSKRAVCPKVVAGRDQRSHVRRPSFSTIHFGARFWPSRSSYNELEPQ